MKEGNIVEIKINNDGTNLQKKKTNFKIEDGDKVKLKGKKVEPIISSKGLKILVVSGNGQKRERFLVGDLLQNGNSGFKTTKEDVEEVEEVEVKVELLEGDFDGELPPKKVEKRSYYKGEDGFGGIKVMNLNLFKEGSNPGESDVKKLKSCLSEADVVICVDTDGVIYNKENGELTNKGISDALADTCKSGKLVISCGKGNKSVDLLLSKECKFAGELGEELGGSYGDVLSFIAYRTNKDVLSRIRRNKVKTGVGGFIGLEELIGQLGFGKSIFGSIFGFNSNSKEKNVKDEKDNKDAKNEKNKEVNNSGNQVK